MKPHTLPGPVPRPGQQVRWRHPRMACALGRFEAFGPGPFEVVGVVASAHTGLPVALVVRAAEGEMVIDAAWLG